MWGWLLWGNLLSLMSLQILSLPGSYGTKQTSNWCEEKFSWETWPSRVDSCQLRQSIVKEIRVLEVGAFFPLSQSKDHNRFTVFFLTGAMSDLKPGNSWSVPASQHDAIPDPSKCMDIVKWEELYFNCLGHYRYSLCQSKVSIARCNTICDQASKNRAYGHIKFDYFFKLSLLITVSNDTLLPCNSPLFNWLYNTSYRMKIFCFMT